MHGPAGPLRRAYRDASAICRSILGRPELKAFLGDTLVTAAAQGIQRLRGFIVLPFLLKSLGVSEYGIWVQLLALSALVGVTALSLHLPLIKSVTNAPETSGTAYFTTLVAILALAAIVSIPMIVAPDMAGTVALGVGGYGKATAAAVAIGVLNNCRILNLSVFRSLSLLRTRATLEFLAAAAEVAMLLTVSRFWPSLLNLLCALCILQGTFVLIQASLFLKRLSPLSFDLGYAVRALRFTAPLVPGALAMWALDRSDRFIIGHYMGAQSVGIYSVVYAGASVINFVLAPLQIALFPVITRLWKSDRSKANRYLEGAGLGFLLLAWPACLILPIATNYLLSQAPGKPDYSSVFIGTMTFIVCLGVLCWGLSVIQTLRFYAEGRTGDVGLITLAAALLNIAINVILTPVAGLIAPAAATLVCYVAVCLALHWRQRDREAVPQRKPVGKIVVSGILSFAPGVIYGFRGSAIAALLVCLGAVIYAAFWSRWLRRSLFAAGDLQIISPLPNAIRPEAAA